MMDTSQIIPQHSKFVTFFQASIILSNKKVNIAREMFQNFILKCSYYFKMWLNTGGKECENADEGGGQSSIGDLQCGSVLIPDTLMYHISEREDLLWLL